ncbi:aspartate aminotransferase family protein [Neptuniibacter sp.]|uniref:aspartate aminotransferase family protein n=1 Tax=Neptuniibacter sp. TaxID=1962643 RepID=UPI0026325412|nr:aspartate aminotransferase family protein [Neptuniibacter sp.]MCP4595078.1 aspartate aminotransferase family protein [Neptuniibacter sp.]
MTDPINRQTFDEVMVPNYSPLPVIPVRGQGSRVWDQANKEYIDFAGGIAVNALGHCHPRLLLALLEQSQRLWHLSNVWTNEPAIKLAQQLCEKTFAERVYFANSGAEANEAAFKLARKHAFTNFGPEKHEIISCLNGFHGRTLFTVSVGGQAKYCEGFEPVPKGITHIPFNDCKALADAISDCTCAVVIEPIQGEGGIQPASGEFLQAARELCDQHNALLIFDEIQTGVGRTGKLYAYQNSSIVPDIMTTAKALGGGFPIGAMLCRKEIAESFNVGSHGSTYGGNPLGCAIANEVLTLVDTPEVLDGVREKGQQFNQLLEQANQKYPLFRDFRGMGLLIGCELKPDYHGKARQFIQIAEEEGLMLLVAGLNVVRLAPSLIIPNKDIDEGMQRFSRAMDRFLLEI